MFVFVGVDGLVWMFDFCYLEYSIIIYEDLQYYLLFCFCWNKQDFNYLVIMVMDGMEVVILDVWVFCIFVVRLNNY